jgi:hypothetical protein
VGPRASLDDVEKRKFLTLPGLELRPAITLLISVNIEERSTEFGSSSDVVLFGIKMKFGNNA